MKINLIPEPRRLAQERRGRVQAWMATTGVMLAVVAAGCAWSLLSIVDSGSKERQELTELGGRIEQLEGEVKAKQVALSDASARLRATLVVTLEPDWSLLMAMLADELKDDAALESFRLVPVESEEGQEVRRPNYLVMLTGVARTQEGVSSYVLNLEELGLFDQVTLKESSRRKVKDEEVVVFNLQCELTPTREGAP